MFENSEIAIISERRVSLTCTIKNILYVLIKKNTASPILLYFCELLILRYVYNDCVLSRYKLFPVVGALPLADILVSTL